MVFGALFDGVFVWVLILNPIPLLVYYLRSVLHLHSVLPLCGSTSGRRFLWFIVAFSLEFVTWCPVKKLANICKPLSLSNQNVFNVEVKFESFYGQTFNLKVLILKEHVRKHGPKKCARKPFWTVLCRNVQKTQIVLNRSEPFWTVSWGKVCGNRSEPFFEAWHFHQKTVLNRSLCIPK